MTDAQALKFVSQPHASNSLRLKPRWDAAPFDHLAVHPRRSRISAEKVPARCLASGYRKCDTHICSAGDARWYEFTRAFGSQLVMVPETSPYSGHTTIMLKAEEIILALVQKKSILL